MTAYDHEDRIIVLWCCFFTYISIVKDADTSIIAIAFIALAVAAFLSLRLAGAVLHALARGRRKTTPTPQRMPQLPLRGIFCRPLVGTDRDRARAHSRSVSWRRPFREVGRVRAPKRTRTNGCHKTTEAVHCPLRDVRTFCWWHSPAMVAALDVTKERRRAEEEEWRQANEIKFAVTVGANITGRSAARERRRRTRQAAEQAKIAAVGVGEEVGVTRDSEMSQTTDNLAICVEDGTDKLARDPDVSELSGSVEEAAEVSARVAEDTPTTPVLRCSPRLAPKKIKAVLSERMPLRRSPRLAAKAAQVV